ncbi:MAG: hypothetical protein WKG03_14140 [Telluria sp.]
MIRHRSRMFLAAVMTLALSASVAASAGPPEFAHRPSWKAPAAQSAHAPVEAAVKAMPVMVAELPVIAPASLASSTAVGAVAVVSWIAGSSSSAHSRPREKPRLWV